MGEVLPPGVGRVPAWWMEITPHHTLDEDDEQVRQMAEDQMAFYYMQLAAADDAGFLLPDGTPKLGADMKPLMWTPTTPWNGRSGGTANAEDNTMGPGGRNFKPGHPVIDPKLFGILESDPDYKAYLTGAKLPPGYFEKMGELANSDGGGTQGILNNLKQTDYGRYGRQAEEPNFKPVWAKKKLRSTTTGANIRQGQYNDSPNKFVNRRRVEANETSTLETLSLEDEQEHHVANTVAPTHCESESSTSIPVAEGPPLSPSGGKKKLVRKVRKVVRTNTPANAHIEHAPVSHVKDDHKTWSHSDYVYNETTQKVEKATPAISEQELKLKEQQEKLKKLQELQRQQQELLKAQKEAAVERQKQMQDEAEAAERIHQLEQQQAKLQQLQQLQQLQLLQQQQMQQLAQPPAMQQHQQIEQQEDYDEMSYEEEEIDDDYTEGSYEEEVVDDGDDNHNELMDLQNILAAKQAELQRLQAQA